MRELGHREGERGPFVLKGLQGQISVNIIVLWLCSIQAESAGIGEAENIKESWAAAWKNSVVYFSQGTSRTGISKDVANNAGPKFQRKSVHVKQA